MDSVPSVGLLKEKSEIPKKHLVDIFSDPKKTLIFMLAVGLLGATLFILFLRIDSSLTATREASKIQPTKEPVEDVSGGFDLKRKEDIQILNSAIVNYHSKNLHYPQSLSNLIPNYIGSLPKDPETQAAYSYRVNLNLTSYEVWAILDSGEEYLLTN